MGGMIGMAMAAMKNSPIKKLVLNDIGPFVETEALQRIVVYGKQGSERTFATLEEVEAYLKNIYSSFAHLSHEQWRRLAVSGTWQTPDKQYQLAYDPKIIENVIVSIPNNTSQWPLWEKIQCPILLLHASLSDVLLETTVTKMQQLQPTLKTVSIPGIGHHVSLMKKDEIDLVEQWLIKNRGQVF